LLRFVEERRRGFSPRAAIDVTASRTGRAFFVSALAAVAGVAVIATSSLPLLQGFGTVVGLNVAIALLSALIVLPPILVWAEERGWVTRGLVPKAILDDSHATEDTVPVGAPWLATDAADEADDPPVRAATTGRARTGPR